MKYFIYACTGLAVLGLALATKTHYVDVGADGQLRYDPPYIHAHNGDIVEFIFKAKNHTATQSSFDFPCSRLTNLYGRHPGFDSGFQPIDASHPVDKTVSFHVQTQDPLWFYCRQTGHCGKGMVFAINPPSSGDETFDNFKKKALATAGDAGGGSKLGVTGNVIDVTVGKDGQLSYTPPHVQAKTGDEIRFTFVSKNHTATQSSFDQPCSPQISPDGHTITGFDTGFQPVASGSAPRQASFIMPQTDKPLWFYCRQTGHCAKGMVFAINPPPWGDHSFDAFRQKAIATGGAKTTAKIIDVTVGKDGQLAYTPPSVHASPGDQVRFTFVSKNHTASQSSFDSPCSPLQGGFDSGFQFVGTSNHPLQSTFTVPEGNNPLWFYCRQKVPVSHCGKGMVFAINPPSSGNTFDAFKAKAIATEGGGGGGKMIDVTVGKDGQLTYTPPYVNAKPGDQVRFTFVSKNHTATQSSFENPCSPWQGGFDSGFKFVGTSNNFLQSTFTVPQGNNPLWFYCRQKVPSSHCAAGMVFAVNPPSYGHTFQAFQQKAKESGADGGGTKTGLLGGALGENNSTKSGGDWAELESLKNTRTILSILLGVTGLLLVLALGALAFFMRRSGPRKGEYVPTSLDDKDVHYGSMYAAPDLTGGKVPGAPPASEHVGPLGYSDEVKDHDHDERSRMVSHSSPYRDPYDAPSGAI
ncbi:uncharacterized protein EI90DRAFT_2992207 [Cantharellus anzutake]|uniref:uncharacterized protein n=1 Tax=Cantharellus anzutake TaxID=1750568 RepID=UPI00190339DF|nr:uncharacterized protein EI90DRAFT_2992207 [Cantharellus anzutake]KAF8337010.1 hypothetical protein EI90DRAFT_2992207 [Cantharellus anzutake]